MLWGTGFFFLCQFYVHELLSNNLWLSCSGAHLAELRF